VAEAVLRTDGRCKTATDTLSENKGQKKS